MQVPLLSVTEQFANCIQTHADATAFLECTLHPQEGGIEVVRKMQQLWKAFFLDKHCMTLC
jgi:hypothetical protein